MAAPHIQELIFITVHLLYISHNRDREEPRGPLLPHHRAYGSRTTAVRLIASALMPTGISASSIHHEHYSYEQLRFRQLYSHWPKGLLPLSYRSGLQRWHNLKLNPFRPRVSAFCSFDTQSGFLIRPCEPRFKSVSSLLLYPLLTSPMRSGSITLPPVPLNLNRDTIGDLPG